MIGALLFLFLGGISSQIPAFDAPLGTRRSVHLRVALLVIAFRLFAEFIFCEEEVSEMPVHAIHRRYGGTTGKFLPLLTQIWSVNHVLQCGTAIRPLDTATRGMRQAPEQE